MTNRQREYLKYIIESFIELGEPVGSKTLINRYQLKVSPATVRHEMNVLEKEKYLEKSHTSSGRIPSHQGYDFFARELASKNDQALEQRLGDIFAKRQVSIDLTLDEAARAITEMAGLTLVTTNSESDELMKSMQLTPIDQKLGTVVIVTSKGRVESKLIEFNDLVKLNDVRIAVRLFKERLIDTKLKDLGKKVISLSPILAQSIKNYEALIKAFVIKVFDFHTRIQNKVYGNNNIIKSDISRDNLAKLMDLMQHKSIWESIEGQLDEDETMKIDIRDNNISIISKKLEIENKSTEISVVGSNRMDYAEAKTALNLLENFFTKK